MLPRRFLSLAVCSLMAMAAAAVPVRAATLEFAAPSGANYDKAEFRLWYPDTAGPVRAVAVLVPGSNGDGRPMADEPFWQAFATKHQLALVACRFTDKPHDLMFVEHYVDVSNGAGPALLDALADFAKRSNHAELASAPLLLWGMSAGGEFNYEFAAWKPERVVAFVVNKGNIYYHALVSPAAQQVPGLLFTGEKDLEYRVWAVNGLFAINRRAGALWALTEEPGIGHEVGRSRDLAAMFFEDMLAARLPAAPGGTLRPLDEKSGLIGDLKSLTVGPIAEKPPAAPTAWLPNARIAKAWQAVVTGKPFE